MLEAQKIVCSKCGTQMNHHADKLDFTTVLTEPDAINPEFGGILEQVHTCPKCGNTEVRRAS